MIWRVLDFLFATALLVGLVLDIRAQRRRWSPDISRGYCMTPPPGWELGGVVLESSDRLPDLITITLRRPPSAIGNTITKRGAP